MKKILNSCILFFHYWCIVVVVVVVVCYLQAIWENQFYYLFGFLFLVFIILGGCVSQISIVMTYFQLCAEVREELI